jgi:Spy/CpxP family protein refolding chaperone
MNRNFPRLLPWALGGALFASAWFNVVLLQRVDAIETRLGGAPSATPTTAPTTAPAPTAGCRAAVPVHIAERLGLTDEQCRVIEGCSMTCMSDRSALARAADATCEELRQLLATNPEDEARATELAQQIGDLRTRELTRLVRSIVKVRTTLTPAQRAALQSGGF